MIEHEINQGILCLGGSNYLIIEISHQDDIRHAQQIELIDLFGNILVEQKIQANINYSDIYSTLEKFQPPVSSFFFYIRVCSHIHTRFFLIESNEFV